MKKELFAVLSLFILLVACNPSDNPSTIDTTNHIFLATIIETETRLLVEPFEGENELRSANQISVSLKDVNLLDDEGNEIKETDFKVGMIVEIEYDGTIAESYPAQILNCYSIKILDET